MTTKNRLGKPAGGRLPNDPLDWVADSPPAEEPTVEEVELLNDAPEAPAQADNERNESMSESIKSGQSEGSNQNLTLEVLRLVEASKNGQLS